MQIGGTLTVALNFVKNTFTLIINKLKSIQYVNFNLLQFFLALMTVRYLIKFVTRKNDRMG